MQDNSVLVHLALPGLTGQGDPVHGRPGETVRLVSDDPAVPHELVRRLLELSPGPDVSEPDSVWVGGENLRAVSTKRGRVLVGAASAGAVFERSTVARALHYRRPDLDASDDHDVLELVGLDLSHLPDGARTRLRRGGEPLGRADRARLALARAVYGSPPLLVIDSLEGDLDDAGRRMLERVLTAYRGTVVMVGSDDLSARLGAREHRLPVPADAEADDGSAGVTIGSGGRSRGNAYEDADDE